MITGSESDKLLFDLKNGDQKAFTRIYQLYNSRLSHFAKAYATDLQGKVIRTNDFQEKSELSISFSEIKARVYLVKIQGESLNATKKIAVQ